jgi:hypothetical protein
VKKEREAAPAASLNFVYSAGGVCGAGIKFHARAAAVAVSISRCGVWCA